MLAELAEVAAPGDVLFGITRRGEGIPGPRPAGKGGWLERVRARIRSWRGFDGNDGGDWHVGLFLESRKRKRHARINAWFIHSTPEKGVHVQQIGPGIFSERADGTRTRVEILRLTGITERQREAVVGFARSRTGSGFDLAGGSSLTYALGLPNILHRPGRFTCQHFVLAAYEAAGVRFPHPTESFPAFNIGKHIGRPLGHPRDHVDLRYPYLMDHHIYRDVRFLPVGAMYRDPESGGIRLQTETLRKYSWIPD